MGGGLTEPIINWNCTIAAGGGGRVELLCPQFFKSRRSVKQTLMTGKKEAQMIFFI